MIVKSVTWENDMINHPVYSEFIKIYNSRMNDIDNNLSDVEQKKQESENFFISKVEKYMGKELDVTLEATQKEIKTGTDEKELESMLLNFYYQNSAKKNLTPNTTISDKKFTMNQFGSNMIYDRIFNKWLDTESSKNYSSSKPNEIRSSAKVILRELKIF